MVEFTLHHGGRVLIDPASIRDVSDLVPNEKDTPELPARKHVQLRAHDGHTYDVLESFPAVRLALKVHATGPIRTTEHGP